jgi:hypothetical protein
MYIESEKRVLKIIFRPKREGVFSRSCIIKSFIIEGLFAVG